MLSFQQCSEMIEAAIAAQPELQLNSPVELYEPVRYVLSAGGKRIRPSLVLMACDLFSGNTEAALQPAIGFEIFHNFTLLHDDIMDKSPVRRNKPTVHVKWDENTAILSGDAMSILACQFISHCHPRQLPSILSVFNTSALQVCEGQQYDMNFENRRDVTEEEYLEMIRLKTAVLLAASLNAGAILADAPENDAGLLYLFGQNIGLAFQIRDDYLDSFGNIETFGKTIGNDIVTNKTTYLLVKAFETATGKELNALNHAISDTSVSSKEKIKRVLDIYNHLDIKGQTVSKMNFYFNKAMECMAEINVSSDRKTQLVSLAETLMGRER
ncbi:MAG: polyprenyl synthetase family protein [Bacteroidia bacterium]|nr:polyprenyl synthetase family protein [Bacteroidia bacterium]